MITTKTCPPSRSHLEVKNLIGILKNILCGIHTNNTPTKMEKKLMVLVLLQLNQMVASTTGCSVIHSLDLFISCMTLKTNDLDLYQELVQHRHAGGGSKKRAMTAMTSMLWSSLEFVEASLL